jgi:hypothetical protein
MCLQFASLLTLALSHLEFPARAVAGVATYYDAAGRQIFQWDHAWVRVGEEVIDGNVDCLAENPFVPSAVNVAPYWGPIKKTPADRKLKASQGATLPGDTDVDNIWWPELRAWLDQSPLSSAGSKHS